MASPGFDIGRNQPQHQHQQSESAPEPAFQEAQKWIEAVTGRRFGDKDFRGGLENGILLCELLSSIKPGLVKKINRLPTPIAGLDNLTLFLRGCEELGLKGSQLFDPGDLQDTSVRANLKGSDCSRKLKNVLITIYWLGKAANSCTSYNGPTLDLKEFEGLLSQMRKESEDTESPKRNIRDSGYIDCWDTERSESLSPPRHGRDDSFDSLDSFGSRSQQTPSPDVVIRASSDGRGSDSETDAPHRKLPDVRKDDMLARRTSYSEPRSAMPFNQYLPNKSNQSAYVPTPLRKKRAEREEGRSSWSTATSPIGGDRPFSHPETIQEEGSVQEEEEEEEGRVPCKRPAGPQREAGPGPRVSGPGRQKTVTWGGESREAAPPAWEGKEEQEARRLRKLEKAGIRVLPAAVRYSSLRPATGEEQEKQEAPPPVPDIILRRDNDFLKPQPEQAWDSGEEDEEEEGEGGGGGERRVPDVQRDDLASRRARMSRLAPRVQQQFLPATCSSKDRERWEGIRRASQQAALERLQQQGALSESEPTTPETPSIITRKDNPFLWPRQQKQEDEEEEGGQGGGPQAVPNVQKDDLARRRAQSGPLTNKDPLQAFVQASITQSDMEKWQRLKINTEPSESEAPPPEVPDIVVRKENPSLRPQEDRGEEEEEEGGQGGGLQAVPNVQKDDLARRRAQSGPLPNKDPRQAFVQASITQSDMEKWQRLKMTTEPSEVPQAPLCQACLEKGSMPPAIQAETAALDDLANRRARANRRAAGNRQRFVHFGPVTEIDQKCWERLSIARPGEEEEEQGAGPGNEAQTLRRLLSAAAVATPTIGLGSQLTERVASHSVALGDTAPAYPLSEDSASDGATAAELAQREHEALDERLAQYREREEEEEEEEDEGDGKLPDLEKDDMLARRTGAFQKSSGGPSFNKFLPLPGSKLQPQKDGLPDSPKAKKEDLPESPKMKTEPSLDGQKPKGEVTPSSPKANPELRFSHRAASVSDEPESVSMIDMRCEEEAILQPHSQARHELMHNQYNKLKEEEDQWQDDLARWKNRRRSASQDLIKKEEERKMMEKLMSGDGSQSQRRKSIKTYKEIVEDKERREQELHEAYRSARSPEEAASILQRYALRFTISEAVLERLQLPKLLDRSVSADPSAPPAGPSPAASSTSTSTSQTPDSSPMKYLRQQSAPAPKFTATVETTLTGVAQTQPHQTQPRSHTQTQPPVPIQPPARSPEHSPTRTVPSKAVPLLTPKPYIQPKASQAGLKTLKSDGMVRVNGETGEAFSRPESGADRVGGASPVRSSLPALPRSPLRAPGSPRKEPPGAKTPTAHPPPAPELAPARDVLQDTSKAQAPPADPAQDTAPSRPTSLPTELQREGGVCEEAGPRSAAQRQRGEGGESTAAPSAWKEDKQDEGQAGSGVAAMATEQKFGVKTTVLLELTPKHEQQTTELSSSANLSKSLDSAQRDRDGPDSGHPAESRTEPPRPSSEAPCGSPVLEDLEKESLTITAPVLNLAKRIDHWSWDPEEERKRQERWQQEQERVLQVKYQQEQEKLKKEWERAQKEVEEEERKYHEEERRILEETVAPLTPRSSALPSPSRGDLPPSADPEDTIVRSLADWERKQELLERQARGEEVKLRDNWCVCNEAMEQKTAVKTDDSEQVAESLHLQSPSQKEANTQAQQNGQRPPVDQGQAAVPELQFIQASPWSSKQPQSPQQQQEEVWKKTASLDRNWTSQQTQPGGVKRSGSCENVGTSPSKSSACPSSMQPQSPNRSVSGKKLCSSCGHPLGKGAAMIIETLSLYFHIQCFKCGICKGQLGDTSTGTDVRIRNGLLNCHQCYIRSRGNPAPTPDEHAAKHTPSLRSHAPVQAVEHALTQTQT
ncbi:LIM and calponin homology domains-containing protein 1-like isoform X7 [Megalops cyprinoides]|uniref:LIM and calponin homology domains-containing protein 1-like isoform X7 n=1 Tax=Megalops cyprinoides TaxID=118141 RepID=UPI001864987F|nr:LIM and calponin homology domains-containing protein 1-like isoform X7 [Megalops cyprinoides]